MYLGIALSSGGAVSDVTQSYFSSHSSFESVLPNVVSSAQQAKK